MKFARVTVAATTAVALLATPVLAVGGMIHPTFKMSEVYFHCPGPTKLQAANYPARLAGAGSEYANWNAAAPNGSLQTGAGCGTAEPGFNSSSVYDAAFRGTFTGNLRSVTVRIHQALLGNVRPTAAETLRIVGDIDGSPIFPVEGPPTNRGRVTLTPVRGANGVVEFFEFTITNLGYAEEVRDADGNVIEVKTGGVATEDGDGTMEHQLTLLIGLQGGLAPNASVAKVGAWTWDSTDAPGGLTFNPPTSAQATVAADLPT
jgi:hypothetical protein